MLVQLTNNSHSCADAPRLILFPCLDALVRVDWAATGGGDLQGRRPSGKNFLELAYGYMPLVWAGTLAHYLPLFLGEAGRLLPVSAELSFHALDIWWLCLMWRTFSAACPLLSQTSV